MLVRFVVERTLILVAKIIEISRLDVTFRTWDIWDSVAYPSIRRIIFFSWEPQSPSFLKVNFDGSVAVREMEQGLLSMTLTFGSL